jgi:hypothetical protein
MGAGRVGASQESSPPQDFFKKMEIKKKEIIKYYTKK